MKKYSFYQVLGEQFKSTPDYYHMISIYGIVYAPNEEEAEKIALQECTTWVKDIPCLQHIHLCGKLRAGKVTIAELLPPITSCVIREGQEISLVNNHDGSKTLVTKTSFP